MCSSTILDPANFAGKREGGMDIGAAIDPGGKIVEDVTGSDKARRIADPAKVIPDSPVVDEAYKPMTDQQRKARTTTAINTDRSTRFYGST